MRLEKPHPEAAKGWCVGAWNSDLPIAVGYASAGIDEPHLHVRTTEIYLVARGSSRVRVEGQTLALEPGDVLVIEPGEAHTFLSSTPDYWHFVVHAPALPGDQARADKQPVPRSRLGL